VAMMKSTPLKPGLTVTDCATRAMPGFELEAGK
jgi:hypothetical protein